MSISYNAKFIVGVSWDAIVTEVPTTVTKYNPDTGAPILVPVKRPPVTAMGQKFTDRDDAERYLTRDLKLDVVSGGYCGEQKFVGVVLAEVNDKKSAVGIPMTKLAAALDAVNHTLKAHGYDGPNPMMLLIQYYG